MALQYLALASLIILYSLMFIGGYISASGLGLTCPEWPQCPNGFMPSAEYFVGLEYSFFGSLLGVPRVSLKDEDAFELFNSYRSRAWKIRGVDFPLRSLHEAGNNNLYAYRYDWDDHRRFIIGDFRELIGAAHATEIPLLTGNNKLVGDYGFLIYPSGPSKRFTSKNMMQFWTNFAKTGKPGYSINGKEWLNYDGFIDGDSNYIILDNRKNLKMSSDKFTFSSLLKDLYKEDEVTDLEKCVVVLQILTFVGDDLYGKRAKRLHLHAEKIVLSEMLEMHQITYEQLVDLGIMNGFFRDFCLGLAHISLALHFLNERMRKEFEVLLF